MVDEDSNLYIHYSHLEASGLPLDLIIKESNLFLSGSSILQKKP